MSLCVTKSSQLTGKFFWLSLSYFTFGKKNVILVFFIDTYSN